MCTDIKAGFIHINKIGQYTQSNNAHHEADRKQIRDQIVDLFKLEQAGTGNRENSTRIIYCVEQINDEIIYLQRPARLNKGFDFTVNTKNYSFLSPTESQPNRSTKTPSHNSIAILLRQIREQNQQDFNFIMTAIEQIYYCEDPSNIPLQNLNNDSIGAIKIETMLKTIKWLFIEQDITYWSFSGRAMLFNGLQNV